MSQISEEEKCQHRRYQHLSRNYGVKEEVVRYGRSTELLDKADVGLSIELKDIPRRSESARISVVERRAPIYRSISVRENALHIAWRNFNSVLNGNAFRRLKKMKSANGADNSTHAHMFGSNNGTYDSIRIKEPTSLDKSLFHSIRHREKTSDGANVPSTSVFANEAKTDDRSSFKSAFYSSRTRTSSTAANGFSHKVAFTKERPALGLPDFLTLDWMAGNDQNWKERIKSHIKFQFLPKQELEDDDSKNFKPLPMFGRYKVSEPDIDYSYRPFFTYWVTTVQVIVMLYTLLAYGIGTDFSNWFSVSERSGTPMAASQSYVHTVVWEQNNFWIGPRFADLVHAGAKYTPCMRFDAKIHNQILKERWIEANQTGCCIDRTGGFCYQTTECPKQFNELIKWSDQLGIKRRKTRVVCGQDPDFCKRPKSVYPFEWDRHDVRKWPVCEEVKANITKEARHMHCMITGRPCCIQMHGQCRITSKEYCDFVRGHYHPEATICSQISCLSDVCGMMPFFRRDYPDQWYRLVTPLIIHAGLIRCIVTVLLQMTIMRSFETMIGWMRLSTIYLVSGLGGYLASSVFVPYMPEVGPAGSQGGVLGALIVHIVYNWNSILNPTKVLVEHLIVSGVLFGTGFLPYVDNWAQLFGFIFGGLLALALIPYIILDRRSMNQRRAIQAGSIGSTFLLFSILLLLFLNYPIDSDFLKLLNCPLYGKICDQQGLILKSWLPI